MKSNTSGSSDRKYRSISAYGTSDGISIQPQRLQGKRSPLVRQIVKLAIGCSVAGYSLPAVAATCVSSTITGSAITTYISGEVYGTSPAARSKVDELDDSWRTAISPQISPSWTGTATNPIGNDVSNLFTINGVDVGVKFINIDPSNDCTGTVNTGIAPELSSSGTLQGQAPRPASLFDGDPSTTKYWNDLGGSNSNRNAALFTFSRPVSAFGAWFGDLETRTIGGGTPAIMRLLDKDGKQIGADILITPNSISNGGTFSTLNQATCGLTNACGKNSTRWIGFVDPIARVKQVLIIVGDNDTPPTTGSLPDTTGKNERFSFIGVNLVSARISGTVFEDANYGGGAGRPLSTAGTAGRANARVEIYDGSGAFKGSVLTNSSGFYEFSSTNVVGGILPGNYTIRVVNKTVTSARTGYANTLVPVQTFRTNGLTNNVGTPDPNRVGGEAPQSIDADNGSTTLSATAQSITSVTVGSADATGIDFGFNFDTIVNKNNAGQGSLRQFILNSNALTGESNLAQSNQPVGFETSIFMIPNGVANSGQNTSYTNQLTNGVAIINLATALDQISGTKTRLDGSTQTTNVRVTAGGAETNPGQLGTGEKVGVNQIDLLKFDRPEIEIKGQFTSESTGSENQIKSIAFNANTLLVSGSNSLVQDNLVGMEADGDTTVSTAGVTGYGITLGGGNSIIVRHNYVKVNQSGIRRDATGTGLLIENNEVDLPTSGQTDTFDGILLIGSGTNDIIRHNLTKNQKGGGIEVGFNGGTLTNTLIENNTVLRNGYDGASPSTETMGVAAYWLTATSTVTFRKNIITGNSGPGVVVMRATGVKLEQNSIFANGTTANGTGLSIDLDPRTNIDPNSYGTPDGVTPNNGTVSTSLPNGNMDYPIFTKAQRVGSTLKLAGYIGTSLTGNAAFTNATIEIYKADHTDNNQNGEVVAGDTLSKPHGEGRYYLGTITAGANGLFDTTLAIPGSLTDGANTTTLIATDKITAIATNTNNSTSEFSEDIPITSGNPNLLLVKRITGINNSTTTSGGDNLAIYQHETSNPYDDNVITSPALAPPDTDRWPASSSVPVMIGGINGGLIKPQDSIEYTVYFLSAGDSDANNVLFCDRVPANVTFSPNTFTNTSPNPTGAARGIAVKLGATVDYYTNTADSDIAQYFPPGIEPNTVYPTISCGKNASNQLLPNDNGAVVVKLGNIPNATGTGTPVTSGAYGFVRFQGRVK
jgi:trimeric autotransporter adhesin